MLPFQLKVPMMSLPPAISIFRLGNTTDQSLHRRFLWWPSPPDPFPNAIEPNERGTDQLFPLSCCITASEAPTARLLPFLLPPPLSCCHPSRIQHASLPRSRSFLRSNYAASSPSPTLNCDPLCANSGPPPPAVVRTPQGESPGRLRTPHHRAGQLASQPASLDRGQAACSSFLWGY